MTQRPAEARLDVRGVTVRYGHVVAVDDASFVAASCAITALVGPSGCGKTSLLRAIAGFEIPASGSVTIAGRPVSAPQAWVPPERRAVGMVFQQGALFPHLDVWRNVRYGVSDRDDADRRTRDALELAGLLDLSERYPDELSGGQQQRVALARALAPAPEIVLFDEPFAGLDAAARQRVREQVCTILHDAEVTAVIVTHDQEEALSVSDHVAVMMHGRVLQIGTPEEVYDAPRNKEIADFIGGGQLVPCEIAGGHLASELGDAASDAPDGPALLLVRPEDLALLPFGGVVGSIVGRRFYGHDLLCTVRLGSGRVVDVRGPCLDSYRAGHELRLGLRPKRYRVYSAADGAGAVGHATPVERTT